MTQTNLIVVVGTRPEATKLSPLLWGLHECDNCTIRVFFTGQQTDLVQQVIDDLEMRDIFGSEMIVLPSGLPDSRWPELTKDRLCDIFAEQVNSLVIVLGDTASARLGAEMAAEARIPVCHIEAGLRLSKTDIPEEINRREITKLVSIHCVPSAHEAQNLITEGVDRKAITTIGDLSALYQQFAYGHLPDAIRTAKGINDAFSTVGEEALISQIGVDTDYILCTFHRLTSLEYWPQLAIWLQNIARNIHPRRLVLCSRPDTRWQLFYKEFSIASNAVIVPAVRPKLFQILLRYACCIITDSAGVQQEGLLSGKQVIVTREEVELYKHHPFLHLVPPPFVFNWVSIADPLMEFSHWVEPNPDWQKQTKDTVDELMRAIKIHTEYRLSSANSGHRTSKVDTY